MLKFFVIVCVLLVPVCALLFGSRGCESVFPPPSVDYAERDDPEYNRARDLAAKGRNAEAAEIFRRLVRQHPDDSFESNFELGKLAFDQGDYLSAVYHFEQYLSLRPDISAEKRKLTSGLINSAKKKFLQKMLPGQEPEKEPSGISAVLDEKYRAVMQQNEMLKREINSLKEQLARAEKNVPAQRGPVPGVPAESPSPPQQPVAADPEPEKPVVPATHTVARGDTLSSISKKYYGTPARWREIYEANRVTMSSPSALKPGMVLKLPRP